MRIFGAVAAVLTVIASAAASQTAGSADPTGLWLVEDGSAVVKIVTCSPALCGLAVLGAAVNTGTNSWGKDWIYSPKADGKYAATLKLASDATLQIHVSAGLFGRDQTWTRPSQSVTPCVP